MFLNIRGKLIFLLAFLNFQLPFIPSVKGCTQFGTKHSASKKSGIINKRVHNIVSSSKIYNGKYSEINSIAMYTTSTNWISAYCSDALIFDRRCFITNAIQSALYDSNPTVEDNSFDHNLFIPRPGCDMSYYPSEVFYSDYPFNTTTYENDISIVKTRGDIIFGNKRCQGSAVEPAWVSCSPEGPPVGYKGCYAASYGGLTPDQTSAAENIIANKNTINILSANACDQQKVEAGSSVQYKASDQICGNLPDGNQPVCLYTDRSPILYCKYWGHSRSDDKGQTSKSHTGNHNEVKNKPYEGQVDAAVGHFVYAYTKEPLDESCGKPGAVIFVKYGSLSYQRMFSKCGYYCSKDLDHGYRCKGNPPKSLGPVYCIPEKIPTNSDKPTNGWTPDF